MAGRAPLAKTRRNRKANARKNMQTCAQIKEYLETSYKYVLIRSILRIWEGGAGAEIEFAELFVEPKLHIPKKCAIYIHTRMKVLIRHSAHFAPSCPIAHSPLLRQSSISSCIQIQCSHDKLGQVQIGLFAQEKAGKPSMFVHLPQTWKILEDFGSMLQIVTDCSCIFLTSSSLILPAFARTIKISSASWPLTWMRNDAEWCG